MVPGVRTHEYKPLLGTPALAPIGKSVPFGRIQPKTFLDSRISKKLLILLILINRGTVPATVRVNSSLFWVQLNLKVRLDHDWPAGTVGPLISPVGRQADSKKSFQH